MILQNILYVGDSFGVGNNGIGNRLNNLSADWTVDFTQSVSGSSLGPNVLAGFDCSPFQGIVVQRGINNIAGGNSTTVEDLSTAMLGVLANINETAIPGTPVLLADVSPGSNHPTAWSAARETLRLAWKPALQEIADSESHYHYWGIDAVLDADQDGVLDTGFTTASNDIHPNGCLLYTSPSPRDLSTSRMPSSA